MKPLSDQNLCISQPLLNVRPSDMFLNGAATMRVAALAELINIQYPFLEFCSLYTICARHRGGSWLRHIRIGFHDGLLSDPS